MDDAEFKSVLTRLQRSATSHQMVDFYREVERLAYRAIPAVPLAAKAARFDKTAYQREYMRLYRARAKAKLLSLSSDGHTVNRG